MTGGESLIGVAVFPTRVGMNRDARCLLSSSACVPHARGDEPFIPQIKSDLAQCSPRAWG